MAPDMEAENKLLRDFYDAWVFLHACHNDPHDNPTFQQTRLKMSAQALTDCAAKVKAHVRSAARAH